MSGLPANSGVRIRKQFKGNVFTLKIELSRVRRAFGKDDRIVCAADPKLLAPGFSQYSPASGSQFCFKSSICSAFHFSNDCTYAASGQKQMTTEPGRTGEQELTDPSRSATGIRYSRFIFLKHRLRPPCPLW